MLDVTHAASGAAASDARFAFYSTTTKIHKQLANFSFPLYIEAGSKYKKCLNKKLIYV